MPSGSGTVQKECTEEELGSWSDMLSKWKDVNNRPAQLSKLIRRVKSTLTLLNFQQQLRGFRKGRRKKFRITVVYDYSFEAE